MLDIRNLSKKYKNGFSLKNISLHLNPGDFTVLFGEDDAGKTALIYHILGLHHFREGEILFNGRSLLRLTDRERMMLRFVPDSICTEPITVKEYFETIALLFADYNVDDAQNMCEYFGVDINAKLSEMSFNENKLAMIIGAVATDPKLLILDEPMNFLMRENTVKLLKLLELLASRGMAILITCEHAADVQDYCTHYLYLQDGVLTHQGLVKDLYTSQKAITIQGGSQGIAQRLLGIPVARGRERATYLYDQTSQFCTLAELIELINPDDVLIESLSIEEILNKDYTRWM